MFLLSFLCGAFLWYFTRGQSGEIEKFNVVLFLAKTDGKSSCLDDSGLKCLNFEEKARVKHCASNGIKHHNHQAAPCSSGIMDDCPDLLQDSLASLISYSRNVLWMTTAVASLDNDTFSNNLRMKKSLDDFEIQYNLPPTKLQRKRSLEEEEEDSNSYRIFPSGPRLNLDNNNQKRSRDDLITEPEHREVFKLRTKRQYLNKRHHNANRQEEKVKSILDNLGVLATIKLTFFGKLFDNDDQDDKCAPKSDGNNDESKQPMQLDLMSENRSENGKKSCLFDLVKKTLYGLMETCEAGFLMIVLGGNLVEIADPYSSLVQSVKFVSENTDERRTLIVVTGSCPPLDEESVTIEQENEQVLIPVFVKGPRCDQMEHTSKLYDVPYSLKNILAGLSIVEENNLNINRRSKREAATTFKKRQNSLTNSATKIFILPNIIMIIIYYTLV